MLGTLGHRWIFQTASLEGQIHNKPVMHLSSKQPCSGAQSVRIGEFKSGEGGVQGFWGVCSFPKYRLP